MGKSWWCIRQASMENWSSWSNHRFRIETWKNVQIVKDFVESCFYEFYVFTAFRPQRRQLTREHCSLVIVVGVMRLLCCSFFAWKPKQMLTSEGSMIWKLFSLLTWATAVVILVPPAEPTINLTFLLFLWLLFASTSFWTKTAGVMDESGRFPGLMKFVGDGGSFMKIILG